MSCIFTIGKKRGPLFEQKLIPFIQECHMPSLVEIGSLVLEKETKYKMWKICDSDNGQQTNLDQKAHLSLQLL